MKTLCRQSGFPHRLLAGPVKAVCPPRIGSYDTPLSGAGYHNQEKDLGGRYTMNYSANEPVGRKSNSTKAIGGFIFLAGLVLMVGTYFTAAPIAIPMMIVGAAYPFVYSYMVNHGADWDEDERDRRVVMSRQEGRRKVREQVKERQQQGEGYTIDSSRYRDRTMV